MAQKMMRHSDPRLTGTLYTHLHIEDEARELAKLPANTPVVPDEDAAKRTGAGDAAGDGIHVNAMPVARRAWTEKQGLTEAMPMR